MTRSGSGEGRIRRSAMLLAMTLLGMLSACSDGVILVAPSGPAIGMLAAKAKGGPAPAAVAIEDALTRLVPSLAGGGSVTVLKNGLEQVLSALRKGRDQTGLLRAVTEVEQAAAQYQAGASVEFQPDLDALRLALYPAAPR